MTRTLTALLILGGGLWYLLQFGLFYPEEAADPFELDPARVELGTRPPPNTLEQALERYLEELPPEVPARHRFALPRSTDLGLVLERARLRQAQRETAEAEEPVDLRVTAPVGEVDRDALLLAFEGPLPPEALGGPGALRAEVYALDQPEEPVLAFPLSGVTAEPFPMGRERLAHGSSYSVLLRWDGGRTARQWFTLATLEEREHLETALSTLRRIRQDRYRTLLEIHLYRALGRTSDAYRLVELARARYPTDPQRRALDDVLRAELDLPPRILKLDEGR